MAPLNAQQQQPPLSPDEQNARRTDGILSVALKHGRSASLNGRERRPLIDDSSDEVGLQRAALMLPIRR